MNFVTIGPTFSFAGQPGDLLSRQGAAVRSATQLPLYEARIVEAPGELLSFEQAGQTQELPVPIPRLPGLDELEIERVGFDLSSAEHSDEVAVAAGNPPADGLLLTLSSSAEGTPVSLKRVEIEGLTVQASESDSYVLAGDGAGGTASNAVYSWDADQEGVAATLDAAAGTAHHLHILIRPVTNGAAGPPAAAAPYYNMPGAGGSMYGPALGGASVSISPDGAGGVKAGLRFEPPLPFRAVRLLVVTNHETSAHSGYPNESVALSWSARTVRGIFDLRPKGVTVTASAAGAGDQEPIVARFDSDPGSTPVAVDFAPAARSLLNKAYPVTQGDDLGLTLRFSADTPGKLRVNLGQASARYLYYPVENNTAAVSVRAAPEQVDIPVPSGLKPSAVSLTIDGRYGPARLIAAADAAAPGIRRGYRIGPAARVAQRITLTGVEQSLPLTRVALYGRTSQEAELLVTFHAGDALRPGPVRGTPLALTIPPHSGSAWHRADLPGRDLPPPHADAIWVCVQATKGVFWWYADLEQAANCQRSTDDGATWTAVPGKPLLQLWVHEIDVASGNPHPLDPLQLTWNQGLLNGDLVGVPGDDTVVPPDFRRFWLAAGDDNQVFLQAIAALDAPLGLAFMCRRDVDLTLNDIVFVYDPWRI